MICDHSKLTKFSNNESGTLVYTCEVCGKKFVLDEGNCLQVNMLLKELDESKNCFKECEQHLIEVQKINEKLEYENTSLKNYINEVEDNNDKIIQENDELKITIRGMCKALGGGK